MYGGHMQKLVIKIFGIWTSLSLRPRRRRRLGGQPCVSEVADTDRIGSTTDSSSTKESRAEATGSPERRSTVLSILEEEDIVVETLDTIGSGSKVGEMVGGGGTINKLVGELSWEL
nr:hypothetical protein Iba_chr02fCG7790 [Ipomoea batatas]